MMMPCFVGRCGKGCERDEDACIKRHCDALLVTGERVHL